MRGGQRAVISFHVSDSATSIPSLAITTQAHESWGSGVVD